MTFVNEGDFISFRSVTTLPLCDPDPSIDTTCSSRPPTKRCSWQRSVLDSRCDVSFPTFPRCSSADRATAYEIRQGTIEQTEADVEWALRPYQRTARKRNQL